MWITSLFFPHAFQSITFFWVYTVWLHRRQGQRLCSWNSSHVTAIIIFKYCKRRGQMLHSDSPYTNHKAHNGAAKSVRERLSFSTEEQAHPRTLHVQFTETAGQEAKEGRAFCNKLFGLKVRTVPCDRIQPLLGVLIKQRNLVGNKTDVLLSDCPMLYSGSTGDHSNS